MRIHLDRVAGLGAFVELEAVLAGEDEAASEERLQRLMGALGLGPGNLLGGSYLDMIT